MSIQDKRNLSLSALKPQAVSAAGTVNGNVFYCLEGQFDIKTQVTATAGTFEVASVKVAASIDGGGALVSPITITDLDRFVQDNQVNTNTALVQSRITGAASPAAVATKGVVSVVGFNNPYADMPYYQVVYTAGGSPANMIAGGWVEIDARKKPVVHQA